MGTLALDRRIDAEVLDAHGGLAVTTGGARLSAVLRDVPQLFVQGAQLSIALSVEGERFEATCRVLDQAVVVTPGSHLTLEVLKARPADISGIEPFDLVPRTPPKGVPPPLSFADEDPVDDEPTGVVGTLREMPVSEIVQTLSQGAKDALVEVRPKGAPGGVIGVERGRVVYARAEELAGEAAFFALLSASRGAFRIRYGRHAVERNVERETFFLLLEGARLLDESGRNTPPPTAPAPPVLEPEEAGVTLVDEVPAPASLSGPFSRFFDEAGVTTPPPLPQETLRFTSLRLPDVAELDDEADRLDTDRTTRERKRPGVISTPPH